MGVREDSITERRREMELSMHERGHFAEVTSDAEAALIQTKVCTEVRPMQEFAGAMYRSSQTLRSFSSQPSPSGRVSIDVTYSLNLGVGA